VTIVKRMTRKTLSKTAATPKCIVLKQKTEENQGRNRR
jgi:hypothetical protein